MSAQLELANFGNKIPDDNVGVFGSTSKPNARLVKDKFGNGRLVTVEVDDDGRNLAIP